MRSSKQQVFSALTVTMLFAALAEGVNAPPSIPAGSLLHVKLNTTLTSKTNKSGDTFTGEITQPIVANGKEVVPKYSMVYGHVAFVKPSGRIKGTAQMRVVLDKVVTPDEDKEFLLPSSLDDSNNAPCAHVKDDEGTIQGCGKSKKSAAKDAAIVGGLGAAAGAEVGVASMGGCDPYYGCYPGTGPGLGTDIAYGAGIGAGTALLYNLFKHEKDIILVEGSELTFTVNRTSEAKDLPPPKDDATSP